VSKSVGQLERELGVDLLERTTREVRLTRAGAELLAAAPEVLAAADRAFSRARDVGRGLAGVVRIGTSPAVGQAVLHDAARVLRDGAPDLSVSVLEIRPRDVAPMLRDRELDLVLARSAPADPDIESAALRPTRAALAVPADHPLARGGPVELRELDGQRLMVWSPPGTSFTDMLLARLAAAGVHVELVESRVTGAPSLTELAALGAVAIRPEGFIPPPDVVEVPLAGDVTLPLLVLWPAGPQPAAVSRLRAGLASA
jgi:DNA-binding transcriptional LysR family regulator